jgi:hypothetical protein
LFVAPAALADHHQLEVNFCTNTQDGEG